MPKSTKIDEKMSKDNGSYDSVDKAMSAIGRSKKRMTGTADDRIDSQEPIMFQGKAKMMNKIMNGLLYMSKEQMDAFAGTMKEDVDDNSYSFNSDLTKLAEDSGLSKEFLNQAGVIMETAIFSKVSEEVSRIENEIQESLQNQIEESVTHVEESVGRFMDHVAEEWADKNELSLDSGLKGELAESLVHDLKKVLKEHNINIDEESVDYISTLESETGDLKKRMNEMIDDLIDSNERVEELERYVAVTEATKGMSEFKSDKIKGLTEGLEFADRESFDEKLKTLIEMNDDTKPLNDKFNEEYYGTGDDGVSTRKISKNADVLDAMRHIGSNK